MDKDLQPRKPDRTPNNINLLSSCTTNFRMETFSTSINNSLNLSKTFCRRQGSREARRETKRSVPVPARAELASSLPRNAVGERDATQAEKISGFADKPLGFYDTAHIVRGPDGMVNLVGLSARRCRKDAEILSESDVNKLRNQTPGWKLLLTSDSQPYLRQDWKMKDFRSSLTLFEKIALIAEEENHHPDLHLQDFNKVTLELRSHSKGGLTENDFIIAARINAINLKDLLPKPKSRFWA